MSGRTRWATAIAAVSVLLIAAGSVTLRGGSTPVGVDDAVERYRADAEPPQPIELADETSAPATPAPPPDAEASPAASAPPTAQAAPAGRPLPPQGVYVYRTTGSENVDVFGGTSHTYPDTTTITVRHTDCGMKERWDALEERWDERATCRAGEGDRLQSFTSYHRFFSRSDLRVMRCRGLAFPAGAEPGDRWTLSCEGDEGGSRSEGRAVAFETLRVGGREVRTLHVRVSTTLHGGQQGTSVRDVWGSLDTGIAIREISETKSTGREPVVGEVTYHERYEIRLKSLESRR